MVDEVSFYIFVILFLSVIGCLASGDIIVAIVTFVALWSFIENT